MIVAHDGGLDLGTPEMIVIAMLVLVLFGAKKLPTFGRHPSRSIDELRRTKEAFKEEWNRAIDRKSRGLDREKAGELHISPWRKASSGKSHPGAWAVFALMIACLLLLMAAALG